MPNLAPAEIKALAKVIDELDYYQILEVPREASASEVKRAYYATSRRFHPDANRHLEGELREALDRIAKRLTEAYAVVRDARRRQAYDRRLLSGEGSTRMQIAEASAEAERAAQLARDGTTPQGRRFFRLAQQDEARGDFAAAARNLQMARTFEPSNAAFQQKLAELRDKLKG